MALLPFDVVSLPPRVHVDRGEAVRQAIRLRGVPKAIVSLWIDVDSISKWALKPI